MPLQTKLVQGSIAVWYWLPTLLSSQPKLTVKLNSRLIIRDRPAA